MSTPSLQLRTRRGTVLIVAMIVIFALASMVLVLGRSTRVEAMASANALAAVQASEIERGAERYVLSLVATEKDAVFQMSEDEFAAVPVGDGYFWALRPDFGEEFPLFGIQDEAAKLDVNRGSDSNGGNGLVDSLERLGLSIDLASAIVDWQDDNSNVGDYGAEDESYRGYLPRNANFETPEELSMVRGFNNRILYGDGSAPPFGVRVVDRTGGQRVAEELLVSRGLYDYVTVFNLHSNQLPDGSGKRINIAASNTPPRSGRGKSALGREYDRLRILIDSRFESDPEKKSGLNKALTSVENQRFNTTLAFYLALKKSYAGLQPADFDALAESLTTSDSDDFVRGTLNLNTAPRELLMTINGLEAEDVDALVSARGNADSRNPGAIAWAAEALDQAKVNSLNVRLTGRASRYSADLLAVSGNGRAFKRVKIVIDVSTTTPRIIYRRDLTSWGWPMEEQVLATLRSGEFRNQYSRGNALAMRNSLGGGVTR